MTLKISFSTIDNNNKIIVLTFSGMITENNPSVYLNIPVL